ncbi:SDR family NAD(P)-dependent oxidoreductase [Chloroflexota bacterium]
MAMQTIAQLFDLTGKGVIVTGGAMGIGKATSMRLAEAGASVLISDIDMEVATKTVGEIEAAGGRAQIIKADASNTADAVKVAKAAVESFGRLDILVNNAGVYNPSFVTQITEQMWDRVHNINLRGLFFYSQAAARDMIKAGNGGKIINIASLAGIHPEGDRIHYDASKGGVITLTRSLALDLAPHNILVNAIAPGGIRTPGAQSAAQVAAMESIGINLEERWQKHMDRTPLGRIGQPDEIAKVVLFLASTAADYITGSVIEVDGGYLLS